MILRLHVLIYQMVLATDGDIYTTVHVRYSTDDPDGGDEYEVATPR